MTETVDEPSHDSAVEDTPDTEPQEQAATVPEDQSKARRRWVGLPTPSSKRWGMNPADRLRVMEACMVLPGAGWITHFVLMMTMSVIVAIMGLSANSAALVIGAMLIAPLMTPVLGIAASIAMALGDAAARAVTTVTAATVGAIALSYAIAALLPDPLLTAEVMARTAPDARDLVVAIAAGIAGSYATARPDVSSSLPGVAIAVALVPPLAVVGITLQADRTELALGALLLYATNLAAIVTVSTVVFVAAGFVPTRRLLDMAPRVIAGALVALVVMVILGVLLGARSIESSERNREFNEIQTAAATWLETTFNSAEVEVNGNNVDITVTGPSALPESAELRAAVAEILDEEPELSVTWIQGETSESMSAAQQEQQRTAAEAEAARQRADKIGEIIEQWLAASGDASVYNVTSTEVGIESVVLAIESASDLPDRADLEALLSAELGEQLDVVINFSDLSAELSQQAIAEAKAEARSIAQEFASTRDLTVDDVSFDGSQLQIDLRGEIVPDGDQLEADLVSVVGNDVEIEVYFVERQAVVPAPTPTPTPEPTPTPVPTPTPEPTPAPDVTEVDEVTENAGTDDADGADDAETEDDE